MGTVLGRVFRTRGRPETSDIDFIPRVSELFNFCDSPADTAFVQYALSDKGSIVFLLTPKCTEVFSLPSISDPLMESLRYGYLEVGGSNEIASLFDAYAVAPQRQDLLLRCCEGLDALGQRMFDVLLSPLWTALKRLAVKRLIISAHLGLERLPWGLIRIPEDGQYLAKRFVISHIPSASVLCQAARQPRPGVTSTGLIVGANHDLSFLEVEQKLIQTILQNQIEVSVDARRCVDRQAFMDVTRAKGHIHLGCHGLFDQTDPLQTRLILDSATESDITLGEVLRSDDFRPLPGFSMVLSACDVGLAHHDKGGNQLGLPTAFLLAQARQVVAGPVARTGFSHELTNAASIQKRRKQYTRYTSGTPAGAGMA